MAELSRPHENIRCQEEDVVAASTPDDASILTSGSSSKNCQRLFLSEKRFVIISCDDSYLKGFPGVMKFLQIVLSLITLICITSSGSSSAGSYLLLPLAWHLRVYVFITVLSLFISLLTLILHITGLVQMLPINWDLFDLIVYSALAFGYLFGASLVASAVDIYQKLDTHVSRWTLEQLIISVVFGYFGLFLFAASALTAYRRLQGSSQFGARKFSTSQTSSSATA